MILKKYAKRYAAPLYYVLKRIVFRSYLFSRSRDIRSYRNVLIVAPHPDDEVFGAGGLILDCIARRARVSVLFMTRGDASHPELDSEEIAFNRRVISERILADMGVSLSNVFRWSFPDGAMPFESDPGFEDAVTGLAKLLQRIAPDAVFVTDLLETWPYDHVSACRITRQALRNISGDCDLFGYFVWLWYSLPLKQLCLLRGYRIYKLHIGKNMPFKKKSIHGYLRDTAPNGKPWSGTLPHAFLKAFNYPYEFFRQLSV